MTKNQENEKIATGNTAAELTKDISDSDGYILITQKTGEDGEKELSISGGKDMSPVDIAGMILTLADQNQDLKTLLTADFLKMAGAHIIETAENMLDSLTKRVSEEAKQTEPEMVQ